MKHHLTTALAITVAYGLVTLPAGASEIALQGAIQLVQGPGSGVGPGDGTGFMNMMTEQERAEFRERMRNATSDADRERVRAEFRERVHQRTGVQPRMRRDDMPGMGTGRGGGRSGRR
jgi:hypothetical protein